jgi:hypothetical protein
MVLRGCFARGSLVREALIPWDLGTHPIFEIVLVYEREGATQWVVPLIFSGGHGEIWTAINV